MTTPSIGQKFTLRFDHPWGGPCPNCKRRKALMRTSRGEKPCTDHRPVQGMERIWYHAIVTEIRPGGIEYRTTERISVTDPLPGTDGSTVDTGGFSTYGWEQAIQDGSIVMGEQ